MERLPDNRQYRMAPSTPFSWLEQTLSSWKTVPLMNSELTWGGMELPPCPKHALSQLVQKINPVLAGIRRDV